MHTQTLVHTVVAAGVGVQKRFMAYAGTQAIAADQVIGVPMIDYVAGQAVAVHVSGVVAVEAGGAIAVGDPIIPDASGRAIKDAGAAANRVGRAVSAVTAAGQTVFILF